MSLPCVQKGVLNFVPIGRLPLHATYLPFLHLRLAQESNQSMPMPTVSSQMCKEREGGTHDNLAIRFAQLLLDPLPAPNPLPTVVVSSLHFACKACMQGEHCGTCA
jgi:hypothetical protein